jgi:glutamate N-acetyltransferase / amino-acid N-acetyltransferase
MSKLQTTIEGVQGFQAVGVNCGLKKDPTLLDFALIVSDQPCVAAGVFTTNTVKAAPVLIDMQHLELSPEQMRAVAINAGCANACTGHKGMENATSTAQWVAEALGCKQENVLVMSTGVIGTHLQIEKMRKGVTSAHASLKNDWQSAATAIMTTDTHPKMASVTVETSQGSYTVAGIAKGAGMIAPNMATLLSTVVTDAKLNVEQAQKYLKQATTMSFNCIVVDGDMSTNDTLLLLANGVSGVELNSPEAKAEFYAALEQVCISLAQGIVRDGEGVTKFITLNIQSGYDDDIAHTIANTIATSPLVKTAFYGGDANWGRIVAAAGRAGVTFNPDCAKLWIAAGEERSLSSDALLLFEAGKPTDYDEDLAQQIMGASSVTVTLDCGDGTGQATVWTCDLSHDYVSINGHYRT